MKPDTSPQGILLVLSGPMTWNNPELALELKKKGFKEATPTSFLPLLKAGEKLLIITDPNGLMQLLHHGDECVAPAIISIFVDAPDAVIMERVQKATPSLTPEDTASTTVRMRTERSKKSLYNTVDQSCCGKVSCLVAKIATMVRRREIEIGAMR